MGREKVDSRHTAYVIKIVCEGTKTEPLFFTELCNDYINKKEGFNATTVPEPDIPDNEIEKSVSEKRGRHRRKPREIKDAPINDEKIYGQPPLKWVLEARKCISGGADEAWAVYDKDGHPTHKEALAEAEREIDGKKINIAFTSRSFEYYMLLHFEYIFKAFDETECCSKLPKNGGRNCCGRNNNEFEQLDCKGERCINGYARIHNYWEESKKSISTYDKLKDHLIKGMVNACRLRNESNSKTNQPIFERNPYTNADVLVGRITGNIPVAFGHVYSDGKVELWLDKDSLHVKNTGKNSTIFSSKNLSYYNWESNEEDEFVIEHKILSPEEEVSVGYSLTENQLIIYKKPDKERVLLLPCFHTDNDVL